MEIKRKYIIELYYTRYFDKNQINLPRHDDINLLIILDSNVLKIVLILRVIIASIWETKCII